MELPSSLAALWRLSHNGDSQAAREADHRAAGVVSICFVLVACYVLVDSWDALWRHHPPAISVAGIVLAILSVGIHPWLAIRKKTIATQLHSLALTSESRQTLLSAYLSAVLLLGLVLNAGLGWWWADPLAGVLMVPVILFEGWRIHTERQKRVLEARKGNVRSKAG